MDEVRQEAEVALVLVAEAVVVVPVDSREVGVVDFQREEGVVLEAAFREDVARNCCCNFLL